MQIFFSVFWWIYFFIFFSGYPLLYGLFYLIGKNRNLHPVVAEKISPLLPITYAFVSTFFWIFTLCTGKMQLVIEKIAVLAPAVSIIFYSLSALLFWLSRFRQKTYISFLHSLPLFLIPFLNILFKSYGHKAIPDDYGINLIRIYTAGFIIYIAAVSFLLAVKWLLSKMVLLKHDKKVLH